MKILNSLKRILLVVFTLANCLLAGESTILDSTLSNKVVSEINSLSGQIFAQTGIFTDIQIGEIKQPAEKKNYAILALDLKHKEIAVLSDLGLDFSPITSMYYLKFGFLPTKGAVLPLLTEPKTKSIEPAVLNGFIAMCELIAHEKGAKLDGVGEFNDNFIAVVRILFYFCIIMILIFIYRKKRRGKKI